MLQYIVSSVAYFICLLIGIAIIIVKPDNLFSILHIYYWFCFFSPPSINRVKLMFRQLLCVHSVALVNVNKF